MHISPHEIKIVTLTGSSGVGKTSIANHLLNTEFDIKIVVSNTSRVQRDSDLLGEYRYEPPEAFREEEREKFLWVLLVHSNYYGTLKESVDEAFFDKKSLSLMMIVPECVEALRRYTKEKYGGGVLSFYILSPGEEELKRRLNLRNEDMSAIRERVLDCKRWDEEALASEIPYIFISNNEHETGILKAAQKILGHLNTNLRR